MGFPSVGRTRKPLRLPGLLRTVECLKDLLAHRAGRCDHGSLELSLGQRARPIRRELLIDPRDDCAAVACQCDMQSREPDAPRTELSNLPQSPCRVAEASFDRAAVHLGASCPRHEGIAAL